MVEDDSSGAEKSEKRRRGARVSGGEREPYVVDLLLPGSLAVIMIRSRGGRELNCFLQLPLGLPDEGSAHYCGGVNGTTSSMGPFYIDCNGPSSSFATLLLPGPSSRNLSIAEMTLEGKARFS